MSKKNSAQPMLFTDTMDIQTTALFSGLCPVVKPSLFVQKEDARQTSLLGPMVFGDSMAADVLKGIKAKQAKRKAK